MNYQNSSNFGHNSAFSWYQQLQDYLDTLKVNFYLQSHSYVEALLIAFGTYYKRVSLYIKSRVTYATGEVSDSPSKKTRQPNGTPVCAGQKHGYFPSKKTSQSSLSVQVIGGNRDGRGSVVPILLMGKGPKYLTCPSMWQVRSHTTRSGKKRLESVQTQPVETPKGLQFLAKHWLISYQNPERVFYDLRGILKQESI